MNCLVIYHIPNNRIRSKVADICMDYGLNRIQYSAFAGDLARTHQQELMKKVQGRLSRNAGRIFLYCVGEREWAQRLECTVIAEKKAEKKLEASPNST